MSCDYSVILPTYNERQNLPIIIYLLNEVANNKQNPLKLEVIIVEDNSPDNTFEVAKKLQTHFNKTLQITILQRPQKLGLGSAYQDGAKKANGSNIIIMDADLSHHPKYIPQMIKVQKQTDCDIVTGTRYTENGGVEGWNFQRKLKSRTANFITKVALGAQFSDYTGSFRLYKKPAFEQLISQTKTKGYSFQMEMLVRAQRKNMTIQELPIIFVDRLYGKSKLGTNQIWIYLKGILQLFFEQ